MAPRLQLHELLKSFVAHVYFQPPENLAMQFPCIVYNVDGSELKHADNEPYNVTRRYQVTVIDPNPDSDIQGEVEKLPMCRFDRWFAADSHNHYVFNLFF